MITEEKFEIQGGCELKGEIKVNGAKNLSLVVLLKIK